jgi:hypothetical protein
VYQSDSNFSLFLDSAFCQVPLSRKVRERQLGEVQTSQRSRLVGCGNCLQLKQIMDDFTLEELITIIDAIKRRWCRVKTERKKKFYLKLIEKLNQRFDHLAN